MQTRKTWKEQPKGSALGLAHGMSFGFGPLQTSGDDCADQVTFDAASLLRTAEVGPFQRKLVRRGSAPFRDQV